MTDQVQPTEIEQENAQIEESAPVTLQDVKEQKVDFFALPEVEQYRLKNDYYESLPYDPETKEAFRKKGYADKEMFRGIDRTGNSIPWKNPEEFKRDVIDPQKRRSYTAELDHTKQKLSQVEEQLAHMAKMMQFQTNSTLESQEQELASKRNQAREEMDFDAYDRYTQQQFEFNQKKSQFTENREVKKEAQTYQYSPEETRAISGFRSEHPDFSRKLGELRYAANIFDKNVVTIGQNRPDFTPEQILRAAKHATEAALPELISQPKQNVFMNTQYQTQSTSSPVKKPDAKPKVLFEQLNAWDQKIIIGEAKKYPGKTFQEVMNIISAPRSKK